MKKTFIRILSIILLLSLLNAFAFAVEGPEGYKTYTGEDYYEKLTDISGIIREHCFYSSLEDKPVRVGLERLFQASPDAYPTLRDYKNLTDAELGVRLVALFNSDKGSFEVIADWMLSCDRYSGYIEPSKYEDTYVVPATFVGIGVEVENYEGENRVKTVYFNSAAAGAGVKAGDIFVSVDGESVIGFSIQELVSKVTGPEGTKVTVGFKRIGESGTLYFTMSRRQVFMNTASGEDLGDGVFKLTITGFNGYDTIIEVINALNIAKKAGAKDLIIDLRDNLGGDTYALLNVMNLLIPEKDVLMLTLTERDGAQDYYSTGEGIAFDDIAILVNNRSASAAEAFAGAMQAMGRAKLIGLQTYGKGMGQQHVELDNLDYAIITVLRVDIPIVGAYDLHGITPDYIVNQTTAAYPMPEMTDMDDSGVIWVGNDDEQVYSIEERLSLLGFFGSVPDNVFDEHTLYAVNALRKTYGLAESPVCGAVSLKLIDLTVERLAASFITIDSQLEYAVKLVKTGW